jgi:hypothetical protein
MMDVLWLSLFFLGLIIGMGLETLWMIHRDRRRYKNRFDRFK